MNKTRTFTRTLITTALLIVGTRILLILLFSLFTYLTKDPGANVFLAALACKAVCDFLCGFMISRAIGRDFSLGTRLFFAFAVTTLLNVAELLLGKLVFPSYTTAFYMIPISVAASLLGAFLSYAPKKHKRHKRKKR